MVELITIRLSFEDATGNITVDLATTTAQIIGGGMGTDTITSVENCYRF